MRPIVCGRLALQCHGAIGYTFEYDLHLWMKRGVGVVDRVG
jgi:alkylation response protein AidB-like acyl-CoA dehydrogenase